ncbi:MAG: transglutaminase [Alphaproteobacteria bacterium]|nr:transglutaminase [Alphaproteobacteria bacterium]
MNVYRRIEGFLDPGRHGPAIAALDGDIGAILAAVRGLLVHDAHLDLYGVTEADCDTVSRATLPVAARLDRLMARADRPLGQARPPGLRDVGTCRDFALLTCAFLRRHDVAVRVRCGFARYFTPGRLEDHWICEYRPTGPPWARADAQPDEAHRRHLGIAFDPADLPDDAFLTADEAWRAYRAGAIVAEACGHGADGGVWFLWVNLARDHLALRDRLTSDWDSRRESASNPPHLDAAWLARGDALAALIGAATDASGMGDPPFALAPF